MAGSGRQGSFRGSKQGNTRERKRPSITKKKRATSTVGHVGTATLGGDAQVSAAQEDRRKFHAQVASEAEKTVPQITPAAASLLASLRVKPADSR